MTFGPSPADEARASPRAPTERPVNAIIPSIVKPGGASQRHVMWLFARKPEREASRRGGRSRHLTMLREPQSMQTDVTTHRRKVMQVGGPILIDGSHHCKSFFRERSNHRSLS